VNVLVALGVAGMFAAAALAGVYLARRVCAGVIPFDDGPRAGRAPAALLVAVAAAAGVVETMRGVAGVELGIVAALMCVLVAIWCSDVRCGIVPDAFTLLPLGALLVAAVVMQQWWVIVSAAIVFVPFAGAAVASRGRGMGWGDVKLVALGGAVLGYEPAILGFGLACTAAVLVALARRRGSEPIAFAPYLVAAIAIPLVLRGA
jgi:prepilin signal peptidase PulO-like enzyme (type II secretory pathway)